MPVDTFHVMPKEEAFKPLPADVYVATVVDCDYEVKPSPFKNADGSSQEDTRQYKFKFVVDEGDQKGNTFQSWVKESLLPAGKKAKNPTLPELLLAITGTVFGPADYDKVNGAFMNTLIGSKLRVNTKVTTRDDGSSFTKVVSYLPIKK